MINFKDFLSRKIINEETNKSIVNDILTTLIDRLPSQRITEVDIGSFKAIADIAGTNDAFGIDDIVTVFKDPKYKQYRALLGNIDKVSYFVYSIYANSKLKELKLINGDKSLTYLKQNEIYHLVENLFGSENLNKNFQSVTGKGYVILQGSKLEEVQKVLKGIGSIAKSLKVDESDEEGFRDISNYDAIDEVVVNAIESAKEDLETGDNSKNNQGNETKPVNNNQESEVNSNKNNQNSESSNTNNSSNPIPPTNDPKQNPEQQGQDNSKDNNSNQNSGNNNSSSEQYTEGSITPQNIGDWERPKVNFDSGAEAFANSFRTYKEQFNKKYQEIIDNAFRSNQDDEEQQQNEELRLDLFKYCLNEAKKSNPTIIQEGFIRNHFVSSNHRMLEDDIAIKFKDKALATIDNYRNKANKLFISSGRSVNARSRARIEINSIFDSLESELERILLKVKYNASATSKVQNKRDKEAFKAEQRANYELTPEGKLKKQKEEQRLANKEQRDKQRQENKEQRDKQRQEERAYKDNVKEENRSNLVKENIAKLKKIGSNSNPKNDVELVIRTMPLPTSKIYLENTLPDSERTLWFVTKPSTLSPGKTVTFSAKQYQKPIDVYFSAGIDLRNITDDEIKALASDSDPELKNWNDNARVFRDKCLGIREKIKSFFEGDKLGIELDYNTLNFGSDGATTTDGTGPDDFAFRQFLAKNKLAIKMNKENGKVIVDTLANLFKLQAQAAGQNISDTAKNLANDAKGPVNAVRDTFKELGSGLNKAKEDIEAIHKHNARVKAGRKAGEAIKNGTQGGYNQDTANPEDNWNATVTTAAADGMPTRLYQKVMKQKIWK